MMVKIDHTFVRSFLLQNRWKSWILAHIFSAQKNISVSTHLRLYSYDLGHNIHPPTTTAFSIPKNAYVKGEFVYFDTRNRPHFCSLVFASKLLKIMAVDPHFYGPNKHLFLHPIPLLIRRFRERTSTPNPDRIFKPEKLLILGGIRIFWCSGFTTIFFARF